MATIILLQVLSDKFQLFSEQIFQAMSTSSIDRINSLEKSKNDCRIKVRVTRMWPTISPDSGTIKGFNLILLDDDVRQFI